MPYKDRIVRHHLLEIIFWPNEDGTFKTILNSAERLQELGIYDDYKLTVPMTHSDHQSMHMTFMSDETKRKISDALIGRPKSKEHAKHIGEGHKGFHHSAETRKHLSELQKGKTLSAEHRKKISDALTGHSIPTEQRKKQSESMKGKFKGKRWKVVDNKRVWY